MAGGATFGAFNAATAAVSVGTINLALSGNLTLELSGNTTLAPLSVTTALNTTASNAINVLSSVSLTVGEFPLIQYAGSIGGTGFAGFTLGTLPLRTVGNLVNNTANQTIDLNVTATDTIRWNGGINNTWDINTTQNWITNTTATITTYLQPSVPGETVTFNDLALGNFSVNIPSPVNPSGVTVDNTTNAYTFNGAAITSASLTKNGTNTLTILNNNNISNVTINAGTVLIGNGGTTGSLGDTAIVNNGTITFNRSNALTVNAVISGAGRSTKTAPAT